MLVACSSGGGESVPPDAGQEAASTQDAAHPADADAAGAPDFCSTLHFFADRCGVGGACGAAQARDCERWAQNFAPEVVLAASSCALDACPTGPPTSLLYDYVTCVGKALSTMPVGPAVKDFEQAWCSVCNGSGVNCLNLVKLAWEGTPQLGDRTELRIYDDAIVRSCEACIPPAAPDGGVPQACGAALDACIHATATAAMWQPPECGGADAGAD